MVWGVSIFVFTNSVPFVNVLHGLVQMILFDTATTSSKWAVGQSSVTALSTGAAIQSAWRLMGVSCGAYDKDKMKTIGESCTVKTCMNDLL